MVARGSFKKPLNRDLTNNWNVEAGSSSRLLQIWWNHRTPVATWEISSSPINFSILAALVSPVANNFIIAPGVVSKPLASNTSGTIASRERISSDVFSADSHKLS